MSRTTRWMSALVFGAALSIGTPMLASAQGGGGGGQAPMTPTDYRKNIMQGFQQNMAALNAARQGQVGNPSHAAGRGVIIHQLSLMLTHAFPEGSPPPGSRALPAIWQNPQEFQRTLQSFQAATRTLEEATRRGNAEEIATAVQGVQRGCGACHTNFRAQAQPPR